MVGQATLDRLVGVQIPVPQPGIMGTHGCPLYLWDLPLGPLRVVQLGTLVQGESDYRLDS
jgi:hypothetical protein